MNNLASKYKGVVGQLGLVFGSENSASTEDSYVEQLLDRISKGTLAEDRRNAITELQAIVAESPAAQLAFGTTGFPILMGVFKEERDDIEMVRGALETLVGALSPIEHAKVPKNEVQPALMNTDLLSQEADSISLLLSLLSEEDFYVRYYTLQILTGLLMNSPNRLQESILTIPRGITRLMDMLMEREVIRNEALLLLTHLTREAEEIQKILVFEGAFEKIFSIIKEEGGSDGGVVVQDSLELLNNLLRNNASNQILLRETIGLDPIVSILRLRGSGKITKQKTINLLSALKTIKLLMMEGSESEPGKDANKLTNKTVLVQKKVLDNLLMLGVETRWAPVDLRCMAFWCISDLISGHPKNIDVLANKVLGEEPQAEPALNFILRITLGTSDVQEFLAADNVFKSFCEKNVDSQIMLASTLIPHPHSMTHAPFEEDVNMPFGSILLQGLTFSGSDGYLETCCRAASVLSHILKDNIQCKERVLKIELETPTPSLGTAELLLHRMLRYLALASSISIKDGNSASHLYIQPTILKLLVTWLADCPSAVQSFLDSRLNLTYLLELVSNPSATVCTRGLAAILLGECVVYNKSNDNGTNAYSVVDAITQKVGLTSYFQKFDEMRKSSVFSSEHHTPSAKIEDDENDAAYQKNEYHPILASTFDSQFITFIETLEANIRENVINVYSRPKNEVVVVPAALEQKMGESDNEYIKRLKAFIEKQCSEIQELLGWNAVVAEDLANIGGRGQPEQRVNTGLERVQVDTLQRDLQESSQRLEMLKTEKAKIESEALMYRNAAEKLESDLTSLSNAYNSLEQANFHLEKELKRGGASGTLDIEAVKSEAREEALKESETELNDLLVCLGQEQTRVEKLSARLLELGEDVDELLEGVGDDVGLPEDEEVED